VSWHNLNKALVALSTDLTKYITTGSYRAQILWLKQQLLNFGLSLVNVSIFFMIIPMQYVVIRLWDVVAIDWR